MKKAIIYTRVSTQDQTTENQTKPLLDVIHRNQWDLVGMYSDQGISGSKGRDKRPGFDTVCHMVETSQCDIVVVWAIDRLGRSTIDLLGFIELLERHNTDLFALKQNIDTTIPAGRLMFTMISAIAQFEREMISERTKAGLARAKNNGRRLGARPVHTDKIPAVKALRREGWTIREIADELGISKDTVLRYSNVS